MAAARSVTSSGPPLRYSLRRRLRVEFQWFFTELSVLVGEVGWGWE